MNRAAQKLGRLGGKAGTGKAKQRSTSFSNESARAAIKSRWAKYRAEKEKNGV